MRLRTGRSGTNRIGRFVGTPFGLAVLGCLVLAGWSLWSGGILDGPIARQVRTSSVYVAAGVRMDQAAAERIIGNRRLVVVMLKPGADLRDGCDSVEHAAAGTVVLLLSRGDDEYDTYGCALIPGREDENFGKAAVAENMIGRGVDEFVDRPLEAVKVVVVNYDLLVHAGVVPDGARTVSPSLPRYLVAAAAIVSVVVGSAMAYVGARRAGRRAAAMLADSEATADSRSTLSAAAAVLAQQIIDLDRQYARQARSGDDRDRPVDADQRAFGRKYRKLTSDYTKLLDVMATADERDEVALGTLTTRVESLSNRCRRLAESSGDTLDGARA